MQQPKERDFPGGTHLVPGDDVPARAQHEGVRLGVRQVFCAACGKPNEESAQFCGTCGAPMAHPRVVPEKPVQRPKGRALDVIGMRTKGKTYAVDKSPAVALVLSLLFAGVGQFYNRDMKKGLLMLLGGTLLSIFIHPLVWPFIIIWSAVDAYQVAKRSTPLWT